MTILETLSQRIPHHLIIHIKHIERLLDENGVQPIELGQIVYVGGDFIFLDLSLHEVQDVGRAD